MRIAFITPEFVTEPYFSGGLANYLHRFSSALAEVGHDVHVLTQSKNRSDSFDFGEVRVHCVKVARRPRWARAVIGGVLNEPEQWLRFGFAAWRTLEALHRAHPVDVVQIPNYRASGLFVSTLSRIPHVTRLSSFQPEWNRAGGARRRPREVVTEAMELLQLRTSRYIYAPSRVLATAVGAKVGARTVDVIPSPIFIETDDLDPGLYRDRLAGRTYLLFVGRYQRHKGTHLLAEALPAIFEALPNSEAVFAGRDVEFVPGTWMETYIRQCTVGFERRVHLLGELRHEQLYPIIQGARLVVLPSLVDNLPNTMLEAMALGRPVVGTLGASFDEVIEDGVSGFLVPSGDPQALAEKVVEAWNHPELDGIGNGAREAVGRFHPDVVVPAALEHFQRIANDR